MDSLIYYCIYYFRIEPTAPALEKCKLVSVADKNKIYIVLHWTGTFLREGRRQNVVAAIREFLKLNNRAY